MNINERYYFLSSYYILKLSNTDWICYFNFKNNTNWKFTENGIDLIKNIVFIWS